LVLDLHLREMQPTYFFFLAGAFLAAAFLVAFFIELILLSKFGDLKKSQCDSYIDSPRTNVKKKMRWRHRFRIVLTNARIGEGIQRRMRDV